MKHQNKNEGGRTPGTEKLRRAKDALILPGDRIAAENKRHRRRSAWRRALLVLLAAAVLVAAGFGAKRGWWKNPYDGLENTMGGQSLVADAPAFSFHAINVGQGDCTLIVCNGQTLLVDAGENGMETAVLQYLDALGLRTLDYVVATHPHSDHIGGLPDVLDAFGASQVILPRLTQAQTPTNETYRALLEAIQNCGAQLIAAQPDFQFSLGGATVTVLGPMAQETENLNDMSVVLRVDYGRQSFLLTGDAEEAEEALLLNANAPLDCTVLKVCHHGSDSSSTEAFLRAVSPEIAVIECGADNLYGHPHRVVLQRLQTLGVRVYRTDLCGSIVIRSDGETCAVTCEREFG